MPEERERLRLYANRYPQVPDELIRDVNRMFDLLYQRIGTLEDQIATMQTTLDDHETRIVALEP